ncbi:MAG: hypothetical protein ACE5KM_10435 [Planctomycetaceae bacterium]
MPPRDAIDETKVGVTPRDGDAAERLFAQYQAGKLPVDGDLAADRRAS